MSGTPSPSTSPRTETNIAPRAFPVSSDSMTNFGFEDSLSYTYVRPVFFGPAAGAPTSRNICPLSAKPPPTVLPKPSPSRSPVSVSSTWPSLPE